MIHVVQQYKVLGEKDAIGLVGGMPSQTARATADSTPLALRYSRRFGVALGMNIYVEVHKSNVTDTKAT